MFSQSTGYDFDGNDGDEFFDNPSLLGGRRGTIFVIDIDKKMFERDEHNDCYIKKAMVQMRDYLNALALSGSMVERVCIIFINAVSFTQLNLYLKLNLSLRVLPAFRKVLLFSIQSRVPTSLLTTSPQIWSRKSMSLSMRVSFYGLTL
jgi:hypothetical protein